MTKAARALTWATALTATIALGPVGAGHAEEPGGRTSTRPAVTPVVTDVHKHYGSTMGGTKVTISGEHLERASKVLFGGSEGHSLKVLSSHKLTVVTPAHWAEAVGVQVVAAGRLSPRAPGAYFDYRQTAVNIVPPLPKDAWRGGASSLDDVACPAPQACFAVGTYRQETATGGAVPRPLAERRTGPTTWRPSRVPLPADAYQAGSALLSDIACASRTFCVAVGAYDVPRDFRTYGKPLVELWNGSKWKVQSIPTTTRLDAVDCPAAGSCVIVGGIGDGLMLQLENGHWTSREVPNSYGLTAVDCLSTTFCAMAGTTPSSSPSDPLLPQIVTLDHGTLQARNGTVPPEWDSVAGTLMEAISCSSSSRCVAVGRVGRGSVSDGLVVSAGPSGVETVFVPDNPYLSDVSCADVCAIAGASYHGDDDISPILGTIEAGVVAFAGRSVLPRYASRPPVAGSAFAACVGGGVCVLVGDYDTPSGGQSVVWRHDERGWTSARGTLKWELEIAGAARAGRQIVAVGNAGNEVNNGTSAVIVSGLAY